MIKLFLKQHAFELIFVLAAILLAPFILNESNFLKLSSIEYDNVVQPPRDYCSGRYQADCADGSYSKNNTCVPCRDTSTIAVMTAVEAAHSFHWNTHNADKRLYGVLWANASIGELFGLGNCQSQRSFHEHNECVLTQSSYRTPDRAESSFHFSILGWQIPKGYTIYKVNSAETQFDGTIWLCFGLFSLKSWPFSIYSTLTVPDPVNDPNRWHQRWSDNSKGPIGPYYKIIDPQGKKTKYWDLFVESMGDELYYRPMVGHRRVPQRVVFALAACFIISGLLIATWCCCSSKNVGKKLERES